jgi:hypothetical protein
MAQAGITSITLAASSKIRGKASDPDDDGDGAESDDRQPKARDEKTAFRERR